MIFAQGSDIRNAIKRIIKHVCVCVWVLLYVQHIQRAAKMRCAFVTPELEQTATNAYASAPATVLYIHPMNAGHNNARPYEEQLVYYAVVVTNGAESDILSQGFRNLQIESVHWAGGITSAHTFVC